MNLGVNKSHKQTVFIYLIIYLEIFLKNLVKIHTGSIIKMA